MSIDMTKADFWLLFWFFTILVVTTVVFCVVFSHASRSLVKIANENRALAGSVYESRAELEKRVHINVINDDAKHDPLDVIFVCRAFNAHGNKTSWKKSHELVCGFELRDGGEGSVDKLE